jgi:vesicle coat complex subunit
MGCLPSFSTYNPTVFRCFQELKSSHREVMVDMIMDVLRVLSSPNMDIRRKTLDIALDLITPRNIDEVVLTLKKEVVKTQNKELEKVGEYRQMLVQVGINLKICHLKVSLIL